MNEYKTADIKISTDSAGAMTAEHEYQGILMESMFFESRAECRRQAVEALKEVKSNQIDWD
tara:strand:- start:815 stop:997 length:183 start_codon:yes stop_codon:yes gene_type:complete